MVLDLDSRLGLVSMKLLWREEGLLCMGVYGSLDVAERVRHTAGEWGLGKRMFFQVGDPMDLRFKAEYFDIVVSDGALHTTGNPRRLLGEIARVAKPAGAILLAQTARPARLRMRKVLSEGTADCPDTLRSWQDARVRSGYTRAELADLVRAAGLERTRVVEDRGFLFIERPGANDPSSWVSEREKYY
jgi:SAM-dependent methyltransferase